MCLAVTFDLTDAGGRVVFAGGSTRMFMFQNPGVPVVVSIRASPATVSIHACTCQCYSSHCCLCVCLVTVYIWSSY